MFLHFGIGGLFLLVAAICHIIVLLHAFKTGLLEGLLYLCVPCYAIYYVLFRFEHESKFLITLGWCVGVFFGFGLNGWGLYSQFWSHMKHH